MVQQFVKSPYSLHLVSSQSLFDLTFCSTPEQGMSRAPVKTGQHKGEAKCLWFVWSVPVGRSVPPVLLDTEFLHDLLLQGFQRWYVCLFKSIFGTGIFRSICESRMHRFNWHQLFFQSSDTSIILLDKQKTFSFTQEELEINSVLVLH